MVTCDVNFSSRGFGDPGRCPSLAQQATADDRWALNNMSDSVTAQQPDMQPPITPGSYCGDSTCARLGCSTVASCHVRDRYLLGG